MGEQKEFDKTLQNKSNGLPINFEDSLEQHLIKVNALSAYKNSIEREVDTLRKIIDTIKQFIKEKGLEK